MRLLSSHGTHCKKKTYFNRVNNEFLFNNWNLATLPDVEQVVEAHMLKRDHPKFKAN